MDNQKLTDEAYVSVYTPISKVGGSVVKNNSELYRCATTEAIKRGEANKGQKTTILGKCNGYYFVQMPDDFKFDDTLSHQVAFTLKSNVTIPVTGVRADSDKLYLDRGDKKKIAIEVLPEQASNKGIQWSINKKSIATINSQGEVLAKKTGKAVVTATTVDGKYTKKITIVVHNEKLQNASPSKNLTIRGESDSFTGIKIKWTSVSKIVGFEIHYKKSNAPKYETRKWIASLVI